MKFYKIVNPAGHNGLIYHEGLNVDTEPFRPYGNCTGGGIYFAREDILAFLDYGTELYEVEPVGKWVYENPSGEDEPKKWKAHKLNMKYVGKVIDNIPYLIEQGANIHAGNDEALRFAVHYGYLNIVKYLVENGADIHAMDELALRWAAQYGHLEVVKYLVEQGADIHARNDYALHYAASHGHLDIVKYLVEIGAYIHARNDWSLLEAVRYGHLDIVKYLVEKGAYIHSRNDWHLHGADKYGYTEIVEYLKSLI